MPRRRVVTELAMQSFLCILIIASVPQHYKLPFTYLLSPAMLYLNSSEPLWTLNATVMHATVASQVLWSSCLGPSVFGPFPFALHNICFLAAFFVDSRGQTRHLPPFARMYYDCPKSTASNISFNNCQHTTAISFAVHHQANEMNRHSDSAAEKLLIFMSSSISALHW